MTCPAGIATYRFCMVAVDSFVLSRRPEPVLELAMLDPLKQRDGFGHVVSLATARASEGSR
jgi:hypothetical protein